MSYLIDRHQALCMADVVAIIALRQRLLRSRVILKDGSRQDTRTRPATLVRRLHEAFRRWDAC